MAFKLHFDILLKFGAPRVLQIDYDLEFTSLVISELKSIRPELVIIHADDRVQIQEKREAVQ